MHKKTLSYKLANKLRDAGFLQNINLGTKYYDMLGKRKYRDIVHNNSVPTGNRPMDGWLKIPSLRELIEACGDGFGGLLRVGKGDNVLWYANADLEIEHLLEHPRKMYGKAPEVAVTKLWFSLKANKKK